MKDTEPEKSAIEDISQRQGESSGPPRLLFDLPVGGEGMSPLWPAELVDPRAFDLSAIWKPIWEQQDRMIEGVKAQLQEAAAQWAEISRARTIHLESPLREILQRTDDVLRKSEPNAYHLGLLGWTVPMWARFDFARYIVDEVTGPDLDEFFLEEYSAKKKSREKTMTRGLVHHSQLSHWRPLIGQCIKAYDRADYLVVVPSLLLILEGAIAAAANQLRRKTPRLSHTARAQRRSARSTIKRLGWASLEGFVAGIFADRAFGAERPGSLNRHWILHGRDAPQWRREDCLRVFQALDTLSVVGWPKHLGDDKPFGISEAGQ